MCVGVYGVAVVAGDVDDDGVGACVSAQHRRQHKPAQQQHQYHHINISQIPSAT